MKRLVLFALILLPSLVFSQDLSLFDSAMAQVGMTRKDIRFDQDEMAGWGGDKYRMTFFTMFHHDPFKFPKFGDLTLAACSSSITHITNLVASSARRIDCPVRRGLIGDALEQYLTPKDSLPLLSITGSKNIISGPEFERLRKKIDLVFRIVDDDQFFLKTCFGDYGKAGIRKKLFDFFVRDSQTHIDLVEEMADKVDLNRLVAGTEDLAEAVRRLADSLEQCSFPSYVVECKTRKGLIVVGTSGDDNYAYLEPPLLIVDGGGNDTYKFGGFPNDYPATIIVDLAGDDRYISTDSTRIGIGGAILGVSILIDKAGNDRYEGANICQGSGIFGSGILLDYSGDDLYSSKNWSQACGSFGMGILADSAGADSFYCMTQSQGFGYTRGTGLLVNFEGDDKYVAEDNYVFSKSQQTKDHNSSLAQGTGFGRRADFVDGHSWAGGVGILCDIRGNDYYSAGLFAQGCAYWFAVGMLLDGSGEDIYSAVWYVQGSGAHFGAAYLDDFAGNDRYTATMNMSQGSGHDFTIGYLNDRAGNDIYTAPTLSVGGGNANGIGLFYYWSGDDIYKTKGRPVLGQANPSDMGARKYLHVFGVFVDGGGNDTYNEPWAENGKRWIGPKANPDKPDPFEIGVGIDR